MPSTTGLPPEVRVVHHPALASTSTEAMRLALAGDPGRLWVVTDDQTVGRGRAGRSWQSVPGNLYASLLVRLACPPVTAQQLALVAGVAVLDGIHRAAGSVAPAGLRLKWPNDVLIGTEKLGGILIETTLGAGSPGLAAAIGIGINLAGVPDGLGRAATSLAHHGLDLSPRPMLEALAWSFEHWLGQWDEGRGLTSVRSAWLERAHPAGEPITVNAGDGPVSGTFAGLDGDGTLLLCRPDGRIEHFTFGDVALGRADAGGSVSAPASEPARELD